MQLENYYYYFPSVLTPKFCDELIQYGKEKKEKIAYTGDFKRDLEKNPLSKKELIKLKKTRNSNVSWFDTNENWIYKEISPYVEKANKLADWNFEWDTSENCQFTKYEKNQYYHWHCDSFLVPYNQPENLNLHGKIRKLSVTCSLSNPSEYDGGELQFNFNHPRESKRKNMKKCTEILPRGSIVVFPSFVWHRVCPVKRGTRYSLVIWNLGKPFK